MVLIAAGIVSVYPLAKSFFPEKVAHSHVVRIGLGSFNDSVHIEVVTPDLAGQDPGGWIPFASLYNSRGEMIGYDTSDITTGAESFQDRSIISTTQPEYIKLTSPTIRTDASCIAYVTITASSNDLRNWNADSARACGKTWYPSTMNHPGTDDFRPPCFWMSSNPKFPAAHAVSWKLTDFAPKGSDRAMAIGQQWIDDPPTLCQAPGRMQYYKYARPDKCVPYFPNALQHDPVDYTDADREYVKHGHRQRCPDAGLPDNDVILYDNDGNALPPVEYPQPPPPEPEVTLTPQEQHEVKGEEMRNPREGIIRRDEAQKFLRAGDRALEMCDHQVVISHLRGHSAKEVCESPTSFGPDFVAIREGPAGIYCDMCEHKWYHICRHRHQTRCWDSETTKLRMPHRRKREEGVLYPEDKVYKRVMRWKDREDRH